MVHSDGLILLKKLCKSSRLQEECIPELVEMLIDFGGIDTEKLTPDMVIRGLQRERDAGWHELGFSARELLSYYAAMGVEQMKVEFADPKAAMVAAIVVMLAATGIPSGIGSGFELANICLILHSLGGVLYDDFEELYCWVAAAAQHTEPLDG